jgi:leucyl aminopeptidase
MTETAAGAAGPVIPVHLVSEATWPDVRASLPSVARAFAEASVFQPKSGRLALLPGASGVLEAVLLGCGEDEGLAEAPFLLGKLATDLPAGRYAIAGTLARPEIAYLGFLLGGYRFDRFKSAELRAVELVPPPGIDAAAMALVADAVREGRDLINSPANALNTAELAGAARALAARHGASLSEIAGDDLLRENFPLIHAVGRAAGGSPRLVDFVWGDPAAPKVTLVGKGVVFDTGGLNLKPDNSMLLMRKDMGGAAAALTAAAILMGLGARIRLRVLLPIVENAVSGNAFRPGDIYRARNGTTVEIGNTDAEGRLVLADALALADEETPALLVDFATLTGAARVALGPDLPPFFTNDDNLAADLARIGAQIADPVWRLPLWKPYRAMLDSKFADLNNVGSGGFAGAVTAALFLANFVKNAKIYLHLDIFGWNPTARPARPEGGEPQAARLIAATIIERYGKISTNS